MGSSAWSSPAETRRGSPPWRASSSPAWTRRPTGGSTRSAVTTSSRASSRSPTPSSRTSTTRRSSPATAGRPLAERGATTQRPLWASTSTKNPAYRDVMYVEDLIGPETVNTMPLETVAAFQDHGQVELTLEREHRRGEASLRGAGGGRSRLRRRHGDARARGRREVLGLLRRAARGHPGQVRRADPGLAMPPVEAAELVERIWARDASLWTGSDEARWLGWLDEPSGYPREPMLRGARRGCASSTSRAVVLLGMGGSSLAPEVMRRTIGADALPCPRQHAPGRRRARLEESRRPRRHAVRRLLEVGDDARDALPSGLLLAGRRARRSRRSRIPARSSRRSAASAAFAAVVWGEPTIGGRYSALSPFGLVPGALMGLDVEQLMEAPPEMQEAAASSTAIRASSSGWRSGNAWLRRSRQGLSSRRRNGFGLWLEQLLAESTGKNGQGPRPGARRVRSGAGSPGRATCGSSAG